MSVTMLPSLFTFCVFFFNFFFFFSSRRRHTRCLSDWSSDVCSSDLYRFRLANPRIFQNYARTWQDGTGQEAARSATGATVPLVENFRSREGILNFVNSFFPLVMRSEIGGVAYDEEARLRFGAPAERMALSLSA